MAHAEVERIWPRDGLIRLEGALNSPSPAPGRWRLELRSPAPPAADPMRRLAGWVRRGPHRRTFPADVAAGGRFETTVRISRLRRSWPRWDLYLVSGRTELRLGRHLDDVRGKAEIFVYPSQQALRNRVKPVYVEDDHLAIHCRRAAR